MPETFTKEQIESKQRAVAVLRGRHGSQADHVRSDWTLEQSRLRIAEVEALLCCAEDMLRFAAALIEQRDKALALPPEKCDCFIASGTSVCYCAQNRLEKIESILRGGL